MDYQLAGLRVGCIMNTTIKQERTWAGTAEVRPMPGNDLLGEASGAFVPVVGMGDSEHEFRDAVQRAMYALDFDLVSLDEVIQIDPRDGLTGLDIALRRRLAAIRAENPVEFGNFHAFHG